MVIFIGCRGRPDEVGEGAGLEFALHPGRVASDGFGAMPSSLAISLLQLPRAILVKMSVSRRNAGGAHATRVFQSCDSRDLVAGQPRGKGCGRSPKPARGSRALPRSWFDVLE